MKPQSFPEKQLEIISSGAADLIQKAELLERLRQGRPLRVKAGFDPSRPDLHLGHAALINKLRQFQGLGHEVIFIVGDFTARIGDPSGQNKTRPILTEEEVKASAKTYIEQAAGKSFNGGSGDGSPAGLEHSPGPSLESGREVQSLLKYFRRLDPQKTRAVYNSEWLGRLSLRKFLLETASHLTVARQLERNDFSERHKAGRPIALHEFLYPALQALDSVEVRADVEIGGTDQLFNLMLGRELQERAGQPPQCVLTLPLLKGTDGSRKMSKSFGNAISFNDSPKEIFGKIMKISDPLMEEYWRAFSSAPRLSEGRFEQPSEGSSNGAAALRDDPAAGGDAGKNPPENPRDRKRKLAFALVWAFHGRAAALRAREEFQRVFSGGGLPDSVPEKALPPRQGLGVCALLREAGLFASSSEARRRIEGGAVKWDGKKLSDPLQKIDLESGQNFLLSSGRRKFIRVKVKARNKKHEN